MHKILLIISFAAFHAAAQVELEAGKQYGGGSFLKVSSLGVSFTLLQGWIGMLPHGSDIFVMASSDQAASIFLAVAAAGTVNPSQVLNQNIPLDQGLFLVPAQTAENAGGIWRNNFSVQGSPQQVNAYAEVREGNNGYVVTGVLVVLPDQFAKRKQELSQLIKGVNFSAAQATSGSGVEWSQYLKGKALKYYYTESGYSRTDFIYLCSDGTFSRSSSDISNSSLGTGSMHGGNEGRWEARGRDPRGTLLLNYNNGNQVSLQIEYGEGKKGKGIYLQGSRYYEDANDRCR